MRQVSRDWCAIALIPVKTDLQRTKQDKFTGLRARWSTEPVGFSPIPPLFFQMDKPKLEQVSAATKAQFTQEIAGNIQRKLERKAHRQEWASKMEELAAQVLNLSAVVLCP